MGVARRARAHVDVARAPTGRALVDIVVVGASGLTCTLAWKSGVLVGSSFRRSGHHERFELAEVLNWMIRRFGPAEVAAAFRPFSAPEVGRLRQAPLPEVDSVRGNLVQLMRAPAQAEP